MFELTNAQRRCFGIAPVEADWERLALPRSRYDDYDTIVYLDGNTVRRCVVCGDKLWAEYQLNEPLSPDRQRLLPKTAKGKEVALSAAAILKRPPVGMALSFSREVWDHIQLYCSENERDYYDSTYEDEPLGGMENFPRWVESWCAETTEADIADISAFAAAPRQHVKFREGDVFRFRIGRRFYGYGRILVDYALLRQKKALIIDGFRGKPLVCGVYRVLTERADMTPEELKGFASLPSCVVMDNHMYYGTYEIIGNIPISDCEDYPLHYGGSASVSLRDMYLQIGKRCWQKQGAGTLPGCEGFAFQYGGFFLNVRKCTLLRCIRENCNDAYWQEFWPLYVEHDLRNPRFADKRRRVLGQFGLTEEADGRIIPCP